VEAPVPADRDSPAGFYGSMGRMAHQQVLPRVKEVLVFGDGRPDDTCGWGGKDGNRAKRQSSCAKDASERRPPAMPEHPQGAPVVQALQPHRVGQSLPFQKCHMTQG
jgi:hypothetical protein